MNALALRTGRVVLAGFVLTVVLLLVSCVNTASPDPLPLDGVTQAELPLDENGRPVGWTEKTHSMDSTADYAAVFPDGKVSRLDITIAPENWEAMQDDMVTKYGEPGALDGGGGFPGGGIGPGDGGGFDGGPGSPGMGEVPDEMVEACEGLHEDDACTTALGGMEITGTCIPLEGGELVCSPEMGFGDRPDGEMPDGGMPDGGGMGGGFGGGENPIYVPCTLEFEGRTWWYVGIRYKGQSTLSSTWMSGVGKLPLRLDFDQFEDVHPEIDNQRFCGFKELSLANNWSDASLLREKVAHDIFRQAGVPAPRTAFYRVYVDFGEGSIYFGLYTMTEIPDDPMLDAQFGDDSGNLYKPTSNWVSFSETDFDKETNQGEEDFSDVEAAIAALHADRSDPEAWRASLEATLNVDEFLHWLAVNTVIQNWDTYGNMAQNYYLYSDPSDEGRLVWIPWDNNMALSGSGGIGELPADVDDLQEGIEGLDDVGPGMAGMGRALSLTLDDVGDNWPLIRHLADDPVYWAMYVSYVQQTIEGPFAVGSTRERYQAEHDLIAPYVVGEEGEQPGYTFLSNPQEFDDDLALLLDHVADRREAVLEFLAGTP